MNRHIDGVINLDAHEIHAALIDVRFVACTAAHVAVVEVQGQVALRVEVIRHNTPRVRIQIVAGSNPLVPCNLASRVT